MADQCVTLLKNRYTSVHDRNICPQQIVICYRFFFFVKCLDSLLDFFPCLWMATVPPPPPPHCCTIWTHCVTVTANCSRRGYRDQTASAQGSHNHHASANQFVSKPAATSQPLSLKWPCLPKFTSLYVTEWWIHGERKMGCFLLVSSTVIHRSTYWTNCTEK